MSLIDRILQTNNVLKAIICCESAILAMARIYINTNNAWDFFLSDKHIYFKCMTKMNH